MILFFPFFNYSKKNDVILIIFIVFYFNFYAINVATATFYLIPKSSRIIYQVFTSIDVY
jgi:hypothetical protein